MFRSINRDSVGAAPRAPGSRLAPCVETLHVDDRRASGSSPQQCPSRSPTTSRGDTEGQSDCSSVSAASLGSSYDPARSQRRGSGASNSSASGIIPPGSFYDHPPVPPAFMCIRTVARRLHEMHPSLSGHISRLCVGDSNRGDKLESCFQGLFEEVRIYEMDDDKNGQSWCLKKRCLRPLCTFCMKAVPTEHRRGSASRSFYRS